MKKYIKRERKGAVALKYDPDRDSAPKVTAKGRGVVADKILDIAKKNNIPIKEDKDLLEMLSVLDINELIPPSLYKTIAEILAFVYSINDKYKRTNKEE